MINDQKEQQIEIREDEEQTRDEGNVSEDKKQIMKEGKVSEDKKQIRNEGEFNDDKNQIQNQDQYLDDKEVEAKWNKIKEPFLLEYSNLTDTDLDYKEGEFGKMLGRVGTKTGMSKSLLRHKIINWEDSPSGGF